MQFILRIDKLDFDNQGIYKISNSIDNKIYIGRTKHFRKRYKEHKKNFEGYGCNGKFVEFIEDNPDVVFYFDILEKTENLKTREEYYIKKLSSVENGFNIIHCDDEFVEISRFVKPKKKKEIHFEIDDIKLLQRGYIRQNGKLLYCPNKTRALLMSMKKKDKPKEHKEERITMRDKSWKPMDFSFFYNKKKGNRQNAKGNYGQSVHQVR